MKKGTGMKAGSAPSKGAPCAHCGGTVDSKCFGGDGRVHAFCGGCGAYR